MEKYYGQIATDMATGRRTEPYRRDVGTNYIKYLIPNPRLSPSNTESQPLVERLPVELDCRRESWSGPLLFCTTSGLYAGLPARIARGQWRMVGDQIDPRDMQTQFNEQYEKALKAEQQRR